MVFILKIVLWRRANIVKVHNIFIESDILHKNPINAYQ